MVVQWARGGRHAGRRGGGRGGRSRVRRVDPDLLGLGGRLGRRGGGRGRVGGLGGCCGLGCQGGLVSEVGAGGKRDGRDDEEGGEAGERVHWVGLTAGDWRRGRARAKVGTPGRSELGVRYRDALSRWAAAPLPDACLPPPVCLGALVVSLVLASAITLPLKPPARPPRPRHKGSPTHALSPA
jgi:hypothetical protein